MNELGKEYASALFMLAVEHGSVLAHYNAGYCLIYGDGVENNYEEGVKLLTIAAENGHEGAQQLLNDLGEKW